MKQKDIALVIIIVFVSGVISFVLSNAIIGSPKKLQEKVEVVGPITSEFNQPSEKYFNKDSTNPTQLIQIGEDPNQQPFREQ